MSEKNDLNFFFPKMQSIQSHNPLNSEISMKNSFIFRETRNRNEIQKLKFIRKLRMSNLYVCNVCMYVCMTAEESENWSLFVGVKNMQPLRQNKTKCHG